MKDSRKKACMRALFFFPFSLILIVGALSFTSCEKKEKTEESIQQIQVSQEEVEKLQKKMAEKEVTINQLREKNTSLLLRIPLILEVQKGDNHWGIAFDYLTQEKGVTTTEAQKILSDSLLFHPLLVGFKVGNYFDEGIYGTFLTQGNSSISPRNLIQLENKKKVEIKVGLESQITELKIQKDELTEKMGDLEKEKKALNTQFDTQITSLTKNIENLQKIKDDLETKLNSVYYLLGTKQGLKARGILKGTFLGICGDRIGEVVFSDFQSSFDLRKSAEIEFQADDLNVSTIQKVRLLPKYYNEGEDYRVEISSGNKSVRIILLNEDKFLLSRIVIFVN